MLAMNTLKQSFKFCSFLRKGILYKLYLVASTNSFILFQMPAIVWCCMNVHVKIFLFKHRHSKTQQWKHLNCWFYLKKKILETAHSYMMFPPWLNYTLPTGKKNPFSTLYLWKNQCSFLRFLCSSDKGSLHFAPISCLLPLKIGLL